MIPIIHHRKIFFSISGVFVGASILALSIFGLNLGIDFRGGSLLQIEYKNERPTNEIIQQKLSSLNLGEITIQPVGGKGAILRFRDVDEETHQKILNFLGSSGELEEKRFESVGPVIGQELKQRSFWAILAVLFAIIIYIAYAFRKVSKPVASWRYGLAAIIALAHDVTIPMGIFAVLGKFLGVEVGLLFVTALLTILGFSVHDTIVVFDRIRENLRKGGLGPLRQSSSEAGDFENTVEVSINQTISRSINTSLVVILVLLAIYLFGGESTKYFALTLIIGIFFGTYSSIFIASPLLVSWERFRQKRMMRRK